ARGCRGDRRMDAVAQGSETTLALVKGRIYPSPDAAPIDDGVVIVVGATIAAVGPPDGIPYYLKEEVPADLLKLLPQPSTPREAANIVRRNIEGGADIIKLFTGSNVSPVRVLPMGDDVAKAAVDAAHRRGMLVFAHPSNVAGLEVALRARVDVLAHAIEDTRGLTAEHLRGMRQQNMALVPTLKLLGDGVDPK